MVKKKIKKKNILNIIIIIICYHLINKEEKKNVIDWLCRWSIIGNKECTCIQNDK